ncbi:hypothetical protein [Tunturiibacter gelidiferens]|uniref:hypothetical protein n=1 Tax=Tunturiibacter gelidiferens TaxID=3069689 RepID=UPI003D9B2024
MTAPTQQSEHQTKLLNRLAVIVDLSRPDYIREAAIREIQQLLPDTNPLRGEEPSELLERVLPPWGTRTYLVKRERPRIGKVSRPPTGLRDVWG